VRSLSTYLKTLSCVVSMDKQAQSGTPFVERTDMPAPRDDRVLLVPLVAGAVGNLLEWYDFGLYGLFAPIFAQLFFPDQDRIASLIGAYSGFAIGFAARPLGAAVLGHLGDRAGRRAVMVYSIVLMGFATTATAILPTHHMIGIAAPMLLLFTRALQGFSVGGEYTGSVTYLVETAPSKRRGLAGSIANVGATAGMLLASGVATATLLLANSAEVRTWAWRIPFLLGGVIATTGYLLRHRMRDTGFTPTASAHASLPLRVAIAEAPGAMLRALLFTSGYGIVNYLTMVFLPTYAATFGGVAEKKALQANTAAQALALFIVPIAAWVTDRAVRRRTLLIIAFAAEFVVGWSGIALASRGGVAGVWTAQLGFAFLLALIMAAEPATLAEQFRSEFRLSAYSVSYNLGIGLAGGTAPLVATALIATTGDAMAPAWYLMLGSAIAAGAAFLMVDRSSKPLR
jgi:MHS family proline/betaine transporter-like MFS transporter